MIRRNSSLLVCLHIFISAGQWCQFGSPKDKFSLLQKKTSLDSDRQIRVTVQIMRLEKIIISLLLLL